MKLRILFTGLMMLMISFAFAQDEVAYTPDLVEGEKLYKTRCTACHKLDARLVGPALKGITEKRSEEWLISFIRNSQEMIDAGDEDAVAIFEEYNQLPMIPNLDLTDDQIRNILGFIDPPVVEEPAVEETGEEVVDAEDAVDEVVVEEVKKDRSGTLGMPAVTTYIIIGLMFILLVLLVYITATFNSIMKDRK